MSLAVASRYARALADVVFRAGAELQPSEAVEQLQAIENLVAGSPELKSILLTPAVPAARKRALMARLAERLGVSRLVRNFLFVVIDRRRVDQLPQIRRSLENLLDERLGLVRADVASARPLGAAQREQLRAELVRVSGRQVRCEFTIQESLIGGAVARVGSTVYDGSVRGQLAELRRRMSSE